MAELYILSQDDELLATISEETGLISTFFREELNRIPSEPFTFTVDSSAEYRLSEGTPNLTQVAGSFIGTTGEHTQESPEDISVARFIQEENQVVFKDKDGDLRLYVIKEVEDSDDVNGPGTTAICEPAFLELAEHVIVDRRFVDREADVALSAALEGTRWTGVVSVPLGQATTNFYYLKSLDAIWRILDVWGGDFKDIVEFDGTSITERRIEIRQRLGADTFERFEIGHNIETISRTIISYPITALYGRGASLPVEDEEGEETGGYTRYITFADVEWSVANGDPVDKPLGQRWVGNPEALEKYGRNHNGTLLHREDIWQDHNIEDADELLQKTWEQLLKSTEPEVNYQLTVYTDEKVNLGDTVVALDREFSRPIEIQTRVIALEYDLLDIDGSIGVEMGQFLSAHNQGDRVDRVIDTIETNRGRWEHISVGNYPDRTPNTPTNVLAVGGFKTNQLYWGYDDSIYIKYYEVYGSQVESFIPSSSHLLWRGDVSAFPHNVDTDQTWYYRIRAVNFHGTKSNFSEQVSASTVRVMTDDMLFGSVNANILSDLAVTAEKLAENAVTEEKIANLAVGNAAIQNGVITNAKIGNLAVDTTKISDGSITNAKIANLAVDNAKIASLSASKLTTGTLNTDQITVQGGSVTDYTRIQGSQLEARGRHVRTWLGETKTHDVRLRFENGYLRARNDTEDWSLYFTDTGISTYADGTGEENTASGSVIFRDHTYSTARSVMVHSNAGVVALKSEENRIVLDADSFVDVLGTTLRSQVIGVPEPYTNLYLGVSGDRNGEVRVTNKRFYNDGDTNYYPVRLSRTIHESGHAHDYREPLSVAFLRNNGRLRYEQSNGQEIFAIRGEIGGGNEKSIRLMGLDNYTTSSSANLYISGAYNVIRSTSARKYKKNIQPLEESYAENFFEKAQPVWFQSKCNADPEHYGYYGYVADDVAEFEPRLVKFKDYDEDGKPLFNEEKGEEPEVEGFHYDRVPALLHTIMKKDRKRLIECESVIDNLKNRLELLENESRRK